jgi:cyclophilin family peptidyl-prolyl cis-trans isomerase
MKRLSLIVLLTLTTACTQGESKEETGLDDTAVQDTAVNDTQAEQDTQVEIVTSMGTVVIVMAESDAPLTTANFLQYVDEGFYDGDDGAGGTLFHRVIPGFMAQGGGLLESGAEKTTRSAIVNESDNGLENMRGTLAMARTNEPNSATSQFIINVVDNNFLDIDGSYPPGYAVFGEVVSGMDVVDAMVAVSTDGSDRPTSDIVIQDMERME